MSYLSVAAVTENTIKQALKRNSDNPFLENSNRGSVF
jgi:hypothetical protein